MRQSKIRLDNTIRATSSDSKPPLKPHCLARRITALALLISAGVIITVILFSAARNAHRNETALAFENASKARVAILKEHIAQFNEAINWLTSFFRASQKVERSEFATFATSHALLHDHILAIEWIPKVPADERRQYEAAARAEGLTDFHFTEIGSDGELVIAGQHPLYYPTYFVVPPGTNAQKPGFDLGSDPNIRSALLWSGDNNKSVVTQPINLHSHGAADHEILLAAPVYRNGSSTAFAKDRRANLSGFVALEICVERLLTDVSHHCGPDGIDLFVYEQCDGYSDRFIGLNTSALRRHTNAIPADVRLGLQPASPTGLHTDSTVDVADKRWRVLCAATPAFMADTASIVPQVILVMGLGLTTLAALLMTAIFSRMCERRKAADALAASHERFKTLFESSRDAIMTLTPDQGFLSANAATAELFATATVGNFIHRHPAELSPEFQPDGRSSDSKAQEMMRIALEEGSNYFEWKHKKLTGQEFDATVLLTRMQVQGRTLLQATVRDITARKEAEERIRQHREMMEVIFHVAPYGMILIDDQLRIAKTNDAAAKMVGREEAEVVDKTCGNGLGCLNAIRAENGCGTGELCKNCFFRRAAESVFLTGQPVDRTQIRHTFLVNGSEVSVWLEVSIEPLTVEWKQYAIVVIANVTEQKEAYEAKGRFLANMSHEIRTPMNAVMGFSDILAAEQLTEQQRGYVSSIRTSGRHLLRVIDDILDFSKIEAGKLEIDPIDCDLAEILAALESLASFRASEKGLEFAINTDDQLPARLHTDPDRVTQCLINLVNNAVKFTAEGHVHLNVSLQETPEGPFIRFEVEDTGIGIPSDKLQKIFESFTQADGGTSRQYGGTGLGLAITRQLASLLGGAVDVRSEEGVGSVFVLTIPAGLDIEAAPKLGHFDRHAEGAPQTAKSLDCHFTGSVLVAEDTATNQVLIRSLLERMGLDVTIVDNGEKAVEAALESNFDLIFMDMQMPVMNGYDATRTLRNARIESPIVALTAHAIKGDDAKCLEAGCDDYLGKPIDSGKLNQILTKYLAGAMTTAG